MNADDSLTTMKPRTFFGIQALRAVAACMVVIFHACELWGTHAGGEHHPITWPTGAVGVDIFFIISGFVMAVSSINKGDGLSSAWNFMKRRIVRIVPLYWIVTSFMLIKLLILKRNPNFGNGSQHALITLPYVISSYLFIPYCNSIGKIVPLVDVGWTLSFEMLFYLLFAAALAFRIGVVRFLTPTLALLAIIGIFCRPDWPSIMTLASPLLLEFLAGLWLGSFVLSGKRMNIRSAAALGVIGIVLLGVLPNPSALMRPAIWGIPSFLIVLSSVMLEAQYGRLLPKWSLLLGNASYSLYLSHLLSFSLCYKVITAFHVLPTASVRFQDEVFTVLICLGISIPVSLLFYRFVEKPIIDAAKKSASIPRIAVSN